MTRIRERREDLRHERTIRSVERAAFAESDRTYRCVGDEDPVTLLGTTGTSALLALEATLLKNEPDRRKERPMRGYSQKICCFACQVRIR
jgi:hypothetical protein